MYRNNPSGAKNYVRSKRVLQLITFHSYLEKCLCMKLHCGAGHKWKDVATGNWSCVDLQGEMKYDVSTSREKLCTLIYTPKSFRTRTNTLVADSDAHLADLRTMACLFSCRTCQYCSL